MALKQPCIISALEKICFVIVVLSRHIYTQWNLSTTFNPSTHPWGALITFGSTWEAKELVLAQQTTGGRGRDLKYRPSDNKLNPLTTWAQTSQRCWERKDTGGCLLSAWMTQCWKLACIYQSIYELFTLWAPLQLARGKKKPILNEFIKGLTPMLVLDWLY